MIFKTHRNCMLMTNLKSMNRWSARLRISLIVYTLAQLTFSCAELSNLGVTPPPRPLTEGEIINGLKEALKVGAEKSVSMVNRTNGYFGNPRLKIPWPAEAIGAYNFINSNLPSARPLLDEVVMLMNRGAEKASEKAKPIFIDAITKMTIQDARNILQGENNAATQFMRQKTFDALHAAFKPDIQSALETVGASTTWTAITTQYNPIARITPGINPLNTDLADYTTTRALESLFLLMEEEELKIRKDPAARITEILRKVFGSLDK